mmetsp:Transcript_5620/g.12486  ORF Transcript_5620/g.12486 Transcript_5620/m.12486 type:complete len:231 (+) Transcript_5620:3166-3858(+)
MKIHLLYSIGTPQEAKVSPDTDYLALFQGCILQELCLPFFTETFTFRLNQLDVACVLLTSASFSDQSKLHNVALAKAIGTTSTARFRVVIGRSEKNLQILLLWFFRGQTKHSIHGPGWFAISTHPTTATTPLSIIANRQLHNPLPQFTRLILLLPIDCSLGQQSYIVRTQLFFSISAAATTTTTTLGCTNTKLNLIPNVQLVRMSISKLTVVEEQLEITIGTEDEPKFVK